MGTNWEHLQCPFHPASQLIPGIRSDLCTPFNQILSFLQSPPSQSVLLAPCHPNLPSQPDLLSPPWLLQEELGPLLLLLPAAQWSGWKEENMMAGQRRLQDR